MPRRTDHNQSPITDELRQLGYKIASTHTVGGGFPDILVSGMKNGVPTLLLVELKSARGKLRPSQVKFHSMWDGFTIIVARSTEDVLRWFGWDGKGTGSQRSDSGK